MPCTAKDAKAWLARQKRAGWLTASGFSGAAGALAALPDAKGGIRRLGAGAGRGQGCALRWPRRRRNCRPAFTGWARCRIFAAAPTARWPG